MLCTLLICVVAAVGQNPPADAPPRSLDPHVVIERFAAEPEIVTPTGIAIDQQGRVLVIESHTHFPPPDYQGPKTDRIRALEDTDGDGRADRNTIFYEGGTATMNLAVYEDNSVFVATRSEVFRLFDRDGDGRADDRQPIAQLETAGDYPHNGLSGFTFDGLGNVYFGLGENLGATYRLIGTDKTEFTGGGEGGSIYRCRPDGTQLTRIATGFWNPFHLCVDAFDRLFAVDNDPDSRPPCRLLHIVPGGDYGYRYRNGRKGLHPFTAWNGELPGTLPMTAGTGEAPSGSIAYESDMLPAEFRGALLVTSWGDHRIDRFRLTPRGASFRALAEPVITGGEDFRPVGIALAADGSLFVSDWVDKSYQLHGRGAVWHIRAPDAKPGPRPKDPREAMRVEHRPLRQSAARALIAKDSLPAEKVAESRAFLVDLTQRAPEPQVRAEAMIALARAGAADQAATRTATEDKSTDVRAVAVRLIPDDQAKLLTLADAREPAEVRAAALARLTTPEARPLLLVALADQDPFIQQAARSALARSTSVDERLKLAADPASAIRLAAVALLRESADPAARSAIPKLLVDTDPAVRFSAVQWVAEAGLSEYRAQIEAGLAAGATTRGLFEAYLAALERLDGMHRAIKDEWSGEQYVLALVTSDDTPAALRARALRSLPAGNPGLTLVLLAKLLASADLATRIEAVRSLRERNEPEATAQLERLVADGQMAELLRAEALVGLPADTPFRRKLLFGLAIGKNALLRHEALRSLRGAELTDAEKSRLASGGDRDADHELVGRLVGAPQTRRPSPQDTAGWLALVEGIGDPDAGERVFYHPRGPACYRCHQVDGRGGTIGPDLSLAVRALTPARLIESLVQPGKEVAPQFAVWDVVRHDGRTLSGVLVAENPDGTRTFGTTEGTLTTISQSDIAEARPRAASIMPENICESLTVHELRDLLAFLRSDR